MDIEVLDQGKFTTSGSSALKMMQNNSIPLLDLIVRESIQNSLDAHLPNSSDVIVNFKNGTFNKDALIKEFPDIKHKLSNINDCSFLSVGDKNTFGLTGNIDGVFKVGEANQNLGKLVFHIMKAQEQESAGGSWGIGKTVYYRFGIGFVIYYSRIRKNNGDFEERIVAALVEDENKKNGILSDYENNIGVAFFGDKCSTGIKASTNQTTINNVLSSFSIERYKGFETGTIIIIPFIDENKLLNFKSDNQVAKWWQKSVDKYLKTSILRWYFPRMSQYYSYPNRLKAYVNDVEVKSTPSTPIFTFFEELTKAAYTNNFDKKINKIAIERKTNMEKPLLGYFVYQELSANELNIKQLPKPYSYINFDDFEEENGNPPIICFCRKPGMIINYDCTGQCTASIKTEKNKFIIGLFVLDSSNRILEPYDIGLDEYVRGSEKSDHASWTDYLIKNIDTRIQIVTKINQGIARELHAKYGRNDDTFIDDGELDNILSARFGRLFMSDTTTTSKTGRKPRKGNRSRDEEVTHSNANKITLQEVEYKPFGVILNYLVEIQMSNKNISFIGTVESIDSSTDASKYEEEGNIYPCNIKNISIIANNPNGFQEEAHIIEPNDNKNYFENYSITFQKTVTNKYYAIKFDNENMFKPLKFNMKISLETNDKLIRTSFKCSLKEEK